MTTMTLADAIKVARRTIQAERTRGTPVATKMPTPRKLDDAYYVLQNLLGTVADLGVLMGGVTTDLLIEVRFFEENRTDWLKIYPDRWVLVKERYRLGTFDSFEAAYAFGLERLGNVPFLIKQVLAVDPVAHIPTILASSPS